MRLWFPFLLLVTHLPGCAEAELATCNEPACRQDEVVRIFESEPTKLQDALRNLTDPVEQMALVRRFVQRQGTDLERLCAAVPPQMPSLSHECGRMLVRPHLRTAVSRGTQPASAWSARTASGPARPALRTELSLDNPWLAEAGPPVPCSSESMQDICQHRAALAAAEAADAEAVAAACMAIPPGRWRNECFFDAVKTFAEEWDVHRIGGAVALCLGAGSEWLDLCLERAVTNRNGEAHDALIPPLSDVSDPRWRSMEARAEAARQALVGVAPDLSEAVVGRLWARVAGRSAAQAESLPDGRLGGWPPVVRPYLRAAVEWQRWRRAHAGPDVPPEIRAWPTDAPGEGAIPAVHYFYADRRAVSADPQTDVLICRLEASARDPGDSEARSLLLQGTEHEDPLIRWTAARLLVRLAHPDRVAPGTLTEPDPAQLAQEHRWRQLRKSSAVQIEERKRRISQSGR